MFHLTNGIFPDRHQSHLTQTAKNREYWLITVLKTAILPIYQEGYTTKTGYLPQMLKNQYRQSAYSKFLFCRLRSWT